MMVYIFILLYFLVPQDNATSMCIIQCGIENSIQHNERWDEILKSIDSCGDYNYQHRYKEKWYEISKRSKSKRGINRWKKQHKNSVRLTIDFLERNEPKNVVDSFFLKICNIPFSSFPYESSGRLDEKYYQKPNKNKLESDSVLITMRGMIMSDMTVDKLYASVITSDFNSTIEQLIPYLDNYAATRLVVGGSDPCEPHYYFSIADVAMELIEMISYCDFYDKPCYGCKKPNKPYNAYGKIYFSKLEERKDWKNNLSRWHSLNQDKSKVDRITSFLNSATGTSYIKTCKNLKFLGYAELAHVKLEEYYTLIHPDRSAEWIKTSANRILSEQ